ncbi:MAG: hypothetical protein ABI624_12845 [Casimicrobiaceae bacterium]
MRMVRHLDIGAAKAALMTRAFVPRLPEVKAMPDTTQSVEQIDARIAAVRENLRQLVEQAAGFSGAADEELVSSRIQEQETQLEMLTSMRARLTPSGSP